MAEQTDVSELIRRMNTLREEQKYAEAASRARCAWELVRHYHEVHPLRHLVLKQLGWLLALQGDTEAITVWKRLFQDYRTAYDLDSSRWHFDLDAATLVNPTKLATLPSLLHDGFRYFVQGAVDLCISTFGDADPATLELRQEFVVILRNMNCLPEATEMCKDIFNKKASLPGSNTSVTHSIVYELAATLACTKDLKLSLEMPEALAKQRGEETSDELAGRTRAMILLGFIMNRDRRLDDRAVSLVRDAYQQAKLIFGDDHDESIGAQYYLAATLNNLKVWHSISRGLTLQEHTELKAMWKELFEKCHRKYGYEHPRTVISGACVVEDLLEREELGAATSVWQELLQGCDKMFRTNGGITTPNIQHLMTLSRLYSALFSQLRAAEGLTLWRVATEMMKIMHGANDRETFDAMKLLASSYYSMGLMTEAVSWGRQVLEQSKKIFGEEHPSTLEAMRSLGDSLDKQGAEDRSRQVLEQNKKIFGEEHPATLEAMRSLGDILDEQGTEDTSALWAELFEKSRRINGTRDVTTIWAAEMVSMVKLNAGDMRGAIHLRREIIQWMRDLNGEDHEDTIRSLKGLVGILHALGASRTGQESQEMASTCEQVYRAKLRTKGESDPETIEAVGFLSQMQQEQQQPSR